MIGSVSPARAATSTKVTWKSLAPSCAKSGDRFETGWAAIAGEVIGAATKAMMASAILMSRNASAQAFGLNPLGIGVLLVGGSPQALGYIKLFFCFRHSIGLLQDLREQVMA